MARKRNYEHFDAAYRTIFEAGYRGWWELLGFGPNSLAKARKHLRERIQRYAFVPSGGRALELGCGDGIMTAALAEAGYSATGLDLSPTVLRRARAQAKELGVRARFLRGDTTRMTAVRDASMDLVLDMNCLHCLIVPAHRRAMLREARRVLRPEGVLYLWTMATPVGPRYQAILDEDQTLRAGQRFRVTKRVRGREVTYDMPLVKRSVVSKEHLFAELLSVGLKPARWEHRKARTISDLYAWAVRDDCESVQPARRLEGLLGSRS